MSSNSEHWDLIYERTDDQSLGWYEKESSPTMDLLNSVPEWEISKIFIVGAGISTLIEQLLIDNAKLSINDISPIALKKLKQRLEDNVDEINWFCQDISHPLFDNTGRRLISEFDIWIDRAVLHFLREEGAVEGYIDNLNTSLVKGGYALFAEFAVSGPQKCADLMVHHYSISELSERLGTAYQLINHFELTYVNPKGDPRPYLYALFQKIQ